MNHTKPPVATISESSSSAKDLVDNLERRWQGVVERRSFLRNIGLTGAALSVGTILATEQPARAQAGNRRLPHGDIALLQFALWAESVESGKPFENPVQERTLRWRS